MPLNFPNSIGIPTQRVFIYHTIHEFPIYSWTVADLHGHVLDIPFVLLSIAFLFSLLVMQKATDEKTTIGQTFQVHPLHLLFIGLLLAAMYMTNAWDGAIYWLLAAMTLIVIHGQKMPMYKKSLNKEESVTIIKQNKTNAFHLWKPRAWQIAWGRDFSYLFWS